MSQNKFAIEVDDLTVAYHQKPVLWDIDLKIPHGVLMAIVGPNGAGKSTLIKSIMNLVDPLAGTITINGDSYDSQKKKIAYVPQRGSVDWDFPTKVLDVVMMGTYGKLGWIKRPGKKEKDQAIDALRKLEMLDFKDRQISQLSGGQQQRVFLARALVQDADIYFMDEPFQGVDATTEVAIIALLKELKEQGKTVVVVHHDLDTVPEYFNWVLLLNVKVVACGAMESTFTTENLKKAYGSKHSFAYLLTNPEN
ncbi:metal ABC transporter ATP-binding protein [Weeksellaceae bacterium KMM 9713]|uniref:Metal ABC transporter ATP-binding protein n=1 Tax=Profundicola chukchiensis TaxID=2961959 RepID=A0A9X4RVA4_9FLAO|nr:metal ABC transporter ATP-binding protein [Profundicola chukchiensis]MDG4946978.1 metal ABC transporter ATP-binding protein [Profundicola chukchiensis]